MEKVTVGGGRRVFIDDRTESSIIKRTKSKRIVERIHKWRFVLCK